MHRRKIQLVAGSSYTVSLPKDWVLKNGLKEKEEIVLQENPDRTLKISPLGNISNRTNEIDLNVDNHPAFGDVLFAAYYIGIEQINIYSKTEIPKKLKSDIRKYIQYMTGTEITYEDKNHLVVKVLMDKSKIDIEQLFYRISLIIDSSLTNISDLEDVQINEKEVDRLYHLATKLISVSLTDPNVLHSSKISNISYIPSYMLINKRLEHMGDKTYDLCGHISAKGGKLNEEIISSIKSELYRTINHLMNKKGVPFSKWKEEEAIVKKIGKEKDKIVSGYLLDLVKYVIDIQEELVRISFYGEMG